MDEELEADEHHVPVGTIEWPDPATPSWAATGAIPAPVMMGGAAIAPRGRDRWRCRRRRRSVGPARLGGRARRGPQGRGPRAGEPPPRARPGRATDRRGVSRRLAGVVSTPTAAERIVAFLVSSRRGVPPEVARAAKRLLLNGLRAALVSRSAPLSGPVLTVRLVPFPLRGSGAPDLVRHAATVEDAAFCNAFNWGLVLLDDIELVSGIHPAGPPSATALAIAESRSARGPNCLPPSLRASRCRSRWLARITAPGAQRPGLRSDHRRRSARRCCCCRHAAGLPRGDRPPRRPVSLR